MIAMSNVVPDLPKGMIVSKKPENIECFSGSRQHAWIAVIDTLKVIDSTKCVEIDVTNKNKNQIQAIKQAVRRTAAKMKYKEEIRFAVKNKTLYVWA